MSQKLDDTQYALELAQRQNAHLREVVADLSTANETAKAMLTECKSLIIAQESALKLYRQETDLWNWIDTSAAIEHTVKAELFVDWYDKTGLIGVHNRRDALQGAFAKAKS